MIFVLENKKSNKCMHVSKKINKMHGNYEKSHSMCYEIII